MDGDTVREDVKEGDTGLGEIVDDGDSDIGDALTLVDPLVDTDTVTDIVDDAVTEADTGLGDTDGDTDRDPTVMDGDGERDDSTP